MGEQEEYSRWIDARYRLISAFEAFRKSVEKNDRNLADEVQEAADEADLGIDVLDK